LLEPAGTVRKGLEEPVLGRYVLGMSNTLHAFDFLAAPADRRRPAPVCVLFGDEAFLKRLVRERLRREVLGDEDADVPVATFDGRSTQWRDVRDEVSTVALFGTGKRLVVVDNADDLVSENRAGLEQYVARPATAGVLILLVGTWQRNTKLFKAVDESGLQVECRAPMKGTGQWKTLDQPRLCKWLGAWAKTRHGIALRRGPSELLLDLVGPEFGVLDQQLAKLALFAGHDGEITPELVRDVVGGWRTKTIWELIDRAVEGNAAEALTQLDQLLQSGEKPIAFFGQIAWSLRRFAAATRIFQQAERGGRRMSLRAALQESGVRKGALQHAERSMKQLGRERAGALYQWLLDADLALKGTHSQDHRARLVLEQLFVRMAEQADPRRQARAKKS